MFQCSRFFRVAMHVRGNLNFEFYLKIVDQCSKILGTLERILLGSYRMKKHFL